MSDYLKITSVVESFPLKRPFTISRGSRTEAVVIKVETRYGNLLGEGECTPYPRYGESIESVTKEIEEASEVLNEWISRNPLQIPLLRAYLLSSVDAGAARNAIDCSLWRLESQLHNVMFPMPFKVSPKVITAMTVSIDTPEAMALQALEYCQSGAKMIKVKFDGEKVIERMTSIHQVTHESYSDVTIIVDANEGWGCLDLPSIFKSMATLNVHMIEQPVPKGEDHKLLGIDHPVVLCADESVHTAADLVNLVGRYEMINIKLDKTGGLTGGFELYNKARELGFKVMVGSMLGTSLAMQQALPIASLADVVDLDGPVLLAKDRKDALKIEDGFIVTR